MSKGTAIFESHRARLFAIALRMLRNPADAEDVLQDAYLRWHEVAEQDVQSPIGFLITATTRLCLDRLRRLKKEHGHYGGPLLPVNVVEDCAPSPEEQHELAGEISTALLAVLERLGPQERATFLLREVFDYDYPEVARMVGKSESACRQVVHRALRRVREGRPRFVVVAESRERLLAKFLTAVGTGDREAVKSLLAEKVEYMADGSRKAMQFVHSGRRRSPWMTGHTTEPRSVSQESPLVRLPVGNGVSDDHGRKRLESGAGRSDARNPCASGPAE